MYSLDAQGHSALGLDPLRALPPSASALHQDSLAFAVALPSPVLWQLLRSKTPLHGHLPSPGVLLVLLLARLTRPHRCVTAHWHCFLESDSGLYGRLLSLYQWFALRLLPYFSAVVTTSPLLAKELHRSGCQRHRVFELPCCISKDQEQLGLALPFPKALAGEPLRLLFIGRLDSYKSLDWLLDALGQHTSPWNLVVVGDGPKRPSFEQVSQRLFPQASLVHFLGRLSESAKLEQLADADVLVLPSQSCNEAFGIVQLEAMAAGRIALALDQPRSGMSWVSSPPGLPWSHSREDLPEVLQRLWISRLCADNYVCRLVNGIASFSPVECGWRCCNGSANMWKGVSSATQLNEGPLVSEQPQPSPVQDRPPVLELENVGLEIPVLTTETRSLKSTLIRSVTGGDSVVAAAVLSSRLCRIFL